MVPTHQRLHPEQPSCPGVDLRLVVENELTAADARVDLVLEDELLIAAEQGTPLVLPLAWQLDPGAHAVINCQNLNLPSPRAALIRPHLRSRNPPEGNSIGV